MKKIIIILSLFLISTAFAQTTINQSIDTGSDDAEEQGPTGNVPTDMYLNSTDLEIVSDLNSDRGEQKVGLRFTAMTIPVGATITNAYLIFHCISADAPMTNNEATNLTIQGELIANAPTFTTTDGNISDRTRTTASISWVPDSWTTNLNYNSPSIADVIQEIVDQGSWASGNAIAIIITGTGHRAGASYDGSSSEAAKLVVTYNESLTQAITIDGNFTDWSGVPVHASDALNDENGTGWDIDKLYITDDPDNVYFRVTFTNTSAGDYDLFLEMSVDPENEPGALTGHSWGSWDNGYDCMVQCYPLVERISRRHISESVTPAVNGWDWEDLGSIETQSWTQVGNYSEIEISFPKSVLDNPNILGWVQDELTQISVIVYAVNSLGNIGEELGSGTNHGGVLYTFDYVLPVELTNFAVSLYENTPTLNWATETETNNIGFEIERKYQESSIKSQDEKQSWENIGFVKGYGHSNSPRNYSYLDIHTNTNCNCSYRLKQIDNDGSYEYSQIVELVQSVPSKFSLSQNYPNPFNPTTNISFSIPNAGITQLRVYDILGSEIAEIVNGKLEAGNYNYEFDASKLTSGVYFYTIKAGSFVSTKKMLLLK